MICCSVARMRSHNAIARPKKSTGSGLNFIKFYTLGEFPNAQQGKLDYCNCMLFRFNIFYRKLSLLLNYYNLIS